MNWLCANLSKTISVQSVLLKLMFLIIKNSDFLVSFWISKHQGRVFDMIKYAWESNKLMVHGFNEMKLLIKT